MKVRTTRYILSPTRIATIKEEERKGNVGEDTVGMENAVTMCGKQSGSSPGG